MQNGTPLSRKLTLSTFVLVMFQALNYSSGVYNEQLGRVMFSISRSAALAAFIFVFVLTLQAAPAQDRRQNQAGQFDFYVLALSWSPSFCEAAQERGRVASSEQCGERPYAFVVHGLWPQYERGFPEYCQVPAPRLDRGIVSSMLDLMPSPRLIFRQWDKHGTCAGFTARSYFDQVRKARAVVKIPPDYLELKTPREVAPVEIEEAFIKANPDLPPGAISVTCDSKRVSEVRICMTKEMQFRDCAELERRSCQRPTLAMPSVRGGATAAR
jgi:ribonuclease T2